MSNKLKQRNKRKTKELSELEKKERLYKLNSRVLAINCTILVVAVVLLIVSTTSENDRLSITCDIGIILLCILRLVVERLKKKSFRKITSKGV